MTGLLVGLLPLVVLAAATSPSQAAANLARSPLAPDRPAASTLGSRPVSQARARSASYPSVPASSVAQDSHLEVIVGGDRVGLRNGGTIRLASKLKVQAYLDPYPPNVLSAWLDLHVIQQVRRHGKRMAAPVKNAVATVEYDMRYMNHGPFKGLAKKQRGGHYLFNLTYIMYGGWDQLFTIQIGRRSYELPLVVVAVPG